MQRLALAFVTCASLLVAADASAFCRLTTAEPSAGGRCSMQGRGLSWDRQCISYSVVDRTSGNLELEAIRDTIDISFGQWRDVTCSDGPLPLALGQTLALGECKDAQYNQFGPNANTIMFLDVWEGEDFPREAFGLTLVWHDPQTGEIFDADMQLNETIAPIALCDDNCSSNDIVDLANVVTHEAGHFLGLGHSNVFGATMSANALLGETSKRSLEQDDRDGVCSIYASYPPVSCQEDDFAPDRGFSPRCGSDEPDPSSCAASTVRSRPASTELLALAALVFAVALRMRRRERSEV